MNELLDEFGVLVGKFLGDVKEGRAGEAVKRMFKEANPDFDERAEYRAGIRRLAPRLGAEMEERGGDSTKLIEFADFVQRSDDLDEVRRQWNGLKVSLWRSAIGSDSKETQPKNKGGRPLKWEKLWETIQEGDGQGWDDKEIVATYNQRNGRSFGQGLEKATVKIVRRVRRDYGKR